MHKLKLGYVKGVSGENVLPQQVPRQLLEVKVTGVLLVQFPFTS